ncbi:sigma-54 dependent transcriptional regulator [Clostridium tagluense]|uniref:sigma-54-dependent transcriptional regulator n=1 Tax=Clostridium tagluense TaxID=360422 RepID=UPI001CF56120|nr:sigma-54 dependent transcriptional regulator [Clostridium tagluense]MCB2310965.1 sigma-54 dependent transcriptional regulator [Clostridium tagluense]MCB2315819.1 sigma-54 dependent transcriptional regulator [Clostridium tagluense]MCB2320537.1 sigma-54 dependent transcriptional regulator [Clostridium tagluense]MCB2325558.1 sigma-54 dependent transcriptional regulator [Clostridium tagluense]MCB2330411.1 sigma-54 dependent transcriptional regulator [Clostridium tagluense]
MKNKNYGILIVDDEAAYSKGLAKILEIEGYLIETVRSAEDAMEKLKKKKYQMVVTDLMMDGMNGIELLEKTLELNKDIKVIVMTAYATVPTAVDAMKKGALSYFVKGNDPVELIDEIEKVYEEYKKSELHSKTYDKKENSLLESENREFKKIIDMARKVAETTVNVILLGESGVGKEVFANYIHTQSPRKNQPFIAVNCHALSESVLESELFGHSKGAFTGATEDRIGRFESANMGTLFLDEIADMPLSTQIKLLRVIEERAIEKIGSNITTPVDFRLITATNKSIVKLIDQGLFREDFYYRINTIIIEIPPLREHKEDIYDLASKFIAKASKQMKKEIHTIEPEVWEYLNQYDYPGNIREFKNIIERLVVFSENGVISKDDLLIHEVPATDCEGDQTLKAFRSAIEKKYIETVLAKNNFSMTKTATVLGITRRQLQNKVNEYEIQK